MVRMFLTYTLYTALVILPLLAGTAPVAAAESRILLLMGHGSSPFEEALAGMREHIEKTEVKAGFTIIRLTGQTPDPIDYQQEIRTNKPDLIVALGSSALEKIVPGERHIPIIATMVLRREHLSAPNVSGVYLEIPVKTQLQWIKKIIPSAVRVGVLYNPDENLAIIQQATKLAPQLGLQLISSEVKIPTQLPPALKNFANTTDILWGISDRTVLTPQTAKDILLFSFRNKVPFIGLSESWVKAGALYALDRNYKDIGAQCGEMILQVIRGEKIQDIKPTPPRKILFSLNEKTAQQLKITIPKKIRQTAQTIY